MRAVGCPLALAIVLAAGAAWATPETPLALPPPRVTPKATPRVVRRRAPAAPSPALTSALTPAAPAPSPSPSLTSAPRGPAYTIDPAIDLPVLALAGVVSSGWLLKGSLAGPHCAPLCDRDDVPAFDRWAAGFHDAGWKTASDIGLATILVGSAATILAAEGPADAVNDAIVVGQSILLANTIAIVSMMGVRRPRPLAYGKEAPLEERMDGNASLSFFSGHTAGSVATAVATYSTFRRLNRPALAYASLGIGLSAATFVGIARVASGDHFPSDVLAGAVVGASTGILLPALHGRPAAVVPSRVGSGQGLSVVGAF